MPICTFTAFWSPVAPAPLRVPTGFECCGPLCIMTGYHLQRTLLSLACAPHKRPCSPLSHRSATIRLYVYVASEISRPTCPTSAGSTLLHVEFCPFRHEFSAPRIATLSVLQLRRDYDKHLYLYALHARANHNSRTRLEMQHVRPFPSL
jgi:hypothetical protein